MRLIDRIKNKEEWYTANDTNVTKINAIMKKGKMINE